MRRISVGLSVLASVCFLSISCNRQAGQPDHSWKPPVKVTDSLDNLVGWVRLYKFQDVIICLQPVGEINRCFFLNRTNNAWVESPVITVPKGYLFWGAVDQDNRKILFQHVYLENQRQVMRILIGTLADNMELQDTQERKLTEDKQSLFGETGSNVQLDGFGLGAGFICDSNMYLPYCASGETKHGKTIYGDEGPFNNGVFHSTDSGLTWQIERTSDFEALDPSLHKTKVYCYYCAARIIPGHGYQLWFSSKPSDGNSWTKPEVITKTYAMTYGHYTAVGEDDMVHVCWMDRRHDMLRFNLEGPNIENDDIAYCHRKDSDSSWSKDVILSKGILYSYSPSMSVEGNNVIVAWSGTSSAGKHHTEYSPNDIYYVTSKDGGNTWSNPLKASDKAKDGFDSGKAQVMLLNGVIHMFYIQQGKLEKPEELSSGLTRFSKQPWPIYYTQRPFPD